MLDKNNNKLLKFLIKSRQFSQNAPTAACGCLFQQTRNYLSFLFLSSASGYEQNQQQDSIYANIMGTNVEDLST